jgi:hypothetical protein
MPPTLAVLDVRSFKGTDAIYSEGARIIRELERIATALEKRDSPMTDQGIL